jgi:hypothetical protein
MENTQYMSFSGAGAGQVKVSRESERGRELNETEDLRGGEKQQLLLLLLLLRGTSQVCTWPFGIIG